MALPKAVRVDRLAVARTGGEPHAPAALDDLQVADAVPVQARRDSRSRRSGHAAASSTGRARVGQTSRLTAATTETRAVPNR